MDKERNYKRVIRNYNRYLYYTFEAKNTLKLIKKLEKDFECQANQTDQFLNQLIRLCDCKRDNVLLRTLANDIANVSNDFKKINNHHKGKFENVVSQLVHISKQFEGLDDVKNKLKEAHANRIKYENRSRGIFYLIKSTISMKPKQNDYNLTPNLKNDYLDNYSGKEADHKLAKLINEENNLEKSLVGQCLNQELAIVIRIRKLVKMFAENQIEYERDLLTLFSQLDLVTERDVNEGILGLNDKELENYFRPKRRDSFAMQFCYDEYSNKFTSPGDIQEVKSPKPIEKQRTNLYYGSLCSLNEKSEKKTNDLANQVCDVCKIKLNQDNLNMNIGKTMSLIDGQRNENIQKVQSMPSIATNQAATQTSPNVNMNLNQLRNACSATSFHKCQQNREIAKEKIDLDQEKSTKEALHNFIYEALKKASDAAKSSNVFSGTFSASFNAKNPSNQLNQNKVTNPKANVSNASTTLPQPWPLPCQKNIPISKNLKPTQTRTCECKNYHSKAEESALAFLNSLKTLKLKVDQCSKKDETTKRF